MSDIIPVDSCPHRTLNMEQDDFQMTRTYWCDSCNKKIIFSVTAMIDHDPDSLAAIICLVFGEHWKDVVCKHNHNRKEGNHNDRHKPV